MAQPLVKVTLLCLAAIAQHVATTPPNPPAAKGDQFLEKKSLFERFPRHSAISKQVVSIGLILAECTMLLGSYILTPKSSSVISAICPSSSTTKGIPSLSALSALSPQLILGLSLMYVSGVIRAWCYKTLGTHFTFELTILRGHKLITSGPYAFVRHPGYTASVLMILGATIIVFDPYGFVRQCGVINSSARWVLIPWLWMQGYTVMSILPRGKVEDERLRKEFGMSWEGYSQEVPCRFIPGII